MLKSFIYQFICIVLNHIYDFANKINKLFSARQHIAATFWISHDCWKTDGKIYDFITWEQTGSDALPVLQQLWGQRLLSAQRSFTGLGGNLSEGDFLLDGRVAEGVRPATELRGIWVLLNVTGWSPRWGVTRGVALLGEQRMNRVSDGPNTLTHNTDKVSSNLKIHKVSLSQESTLNPQPLARQKQAILWDMHVQPSSFRQSKTSDLLPATSNYWFSTHPALSLSLSSLSLGSLPQAEVAVLVVAWLHTHFEIYCMLMVCVTEPHQTHMSRWRWTAAQWRFLAAVYCDGYRKGLSSSLCFLSLRYGGSWTHALLWVSTQ